MSSQSLLADLQEMPGWVPREAQNYLAHTEAGQSIREIARATGCHASTVMRQVRKVESLRDDPLIDAALKDLAGHMSRVRGGAGAQGGQVPDGATLKDHARRILRRLGERGALLAVAEGMEKAVILRGETRLDVVSATIARALALNAWIACDTAGRVARYRITPDGREALAQLVAETENRAQGFAEAQAGFDGPRPARGGMPRSESPLQVLARHRDKGGVAFLSPDLVAAGERLRTDFEISQLSPSMVQNWDGFLTAGTRGSGGGGLPPAASMMDARRRFTAAITDLGPGLGDIALRCCCLLEGLETTERRMGWSQRSGKIVLRIALQRLKRHYEQSPNGDLIG